MQNPAYVEYEQLQRELHAMIAAGQGETSEAEAIRERMDPLGQQLTGEEQARLDGLSADLYMLSGHEIVEHSRYSELSLPAFYREMLEAQNWNDWDAVLAMLRQRPPSAPPEAVAMSRSKAYQRIDHLEPALLFLDYAARQRPQNVGYKGLRLLLLTSLNKYSEAVPEARRYMAMQDAPADLLVAAASSLFHSLESRDLGGIEGSYQEILDVLAKALDPVRSVGWIQRTFAIFGWILVAACRLKLKQPGTAIAALQEASRLAPNDGPILAALDSIQHSATPSEVFRDVRHALAHVAAAEFDVVGIVEPRTAA